MGFLAEHIKVLLYAYAASALLGFSFFLAFLRDVTNLTIFQMRAIFAFIFLIFMEHTSWFRIMWRIMRGQRENKQESVGDFLISARAGAILPALHALHRLATGGDLAHSLPHYHLLLHLEFADLFGIHFV